ncbi:hypothetical protein VNO77_23781 [Canavalia gladiata]|uniref:Uncharacterized protein n=1 Tax=Canavalia gladiata TaxID=3824 RepID=A0AAN9L5V1_CANGL
MSLALLGWVSWFLDERAMREAGFTEQRTPLGLDSGGITGCLHFLLTQSLRLEFFEYLLHHYKVYLANLVNEVALLAGRQNNTVVKKINFIQAVEKSVVSALAVALSIIPANPVLALFNVWDFNAPGMLPYYLLHECILIAASFGLSNDALMMLNLQNRRVKSYTSGSDL